MQRKRGRRKPPTGEAFQRPRRKWKSPAAGDEGIGVGVLGGTKEEIEVIAVGSRLVPRDRDANHRLGRSGG